MFKKHGNPIIDDLIKSHKERSCDLSSLSVIKREGLKFCAWCGIGQIKRGNQKYCTPECSRSAMATFYPQKEQSLAALLIKQNYKCNICQFDYAPFMDMIAAADGPSYSGTGTMVTDWRNNYIWYYYKRLKMKVPKESKPEVDHIIPIYKGGQSLGLDNHQCICYSCHKKKTSNDLSGKRK